MLPRSVRRIYVLRDTPRAPRDEGDCVTRLLRARTTIGTKCAQSRTAMLVFDAQTRAARGVWNAHVLNLNRLMCNATVCPPVIGGVYVRKDRGHMTRAFAGTLGPYLLRASADHDGWCQWIARGATD